MRPNGLGLGDAAGLAALGHHSLLGNPIHYGENFFDNKGYNTRPEFGFDVHLFFAHLANTGYLVSISRRQMRR